MALNFIEILGDEGEERFQRSMARNFIGTLGIEVEREYRKNMALNFIEILGDEGEGPDGERKRKKKNPKKNMKTVGKDEEDTSL